MDWTAVVAVALGALWGADMALNEDSLPLRIFGLVNLWLSGVMAGLLLGVFVIEVSK